MKGFIIIVCIAVALTSVGVLPAFSRASETEPDSCCCAALCACCAPATTEPDTSCACSLTPDDAPDTTPAVPSQTTMPDSEAGRSRSAAVVGDDPLASPRIAAHARILLQAAGPPAHAASYIEHGALLI